jgi:hypothetical protein
MPEPDFRLFLGKSGSGKTWLALRQARGARRVLIHDPNGEDQSAAGAVPIYDPAGLAEAMAAPRWRIAWRGAMAATDDAAKVAAWEHANRCALAAGNCLVIWDEVDFFTTAGRLPPYAYRIVNAGRHVGLRVFACARRAYRLPRDLSANANRIIAFRMTEPRDVRYLADVMGEAASQLPALGEREALDWTEAGTARKKSPFG